MSPLTGNVTIWHIYIYIYIRKIAYCGVVFLILGCTVFKMGTQCRSWLRYCATSWQVEGSISDGIIEDLSLT
jgi:hypothetical protein